MDFVFPRNESEQSSFQHINVRENQKEYLNFNLHQRTVEVELDIRGRIIVTIGNVNVSCNGVIDS